MVVAKQPSKRSSQTRKRAAPKAHATPPAAAAIADEQRAEAVEAPARGRKGGDLVVVESPTKAKTLGRMLGPGYTVEASFGHIRDLPKSKLGIDLATFAPEYVIPPDSEKHARLLKKEAKIADRVWLASDLDREGEAIA